MRIQYARKLSFFARYIDRSHGRSLGQIFSEANMLITASVGYVVMQFMET